MHLAISNHNPNRAYWIHSLNNGGIEKLTWATGVPFPILLIEIEAVKMANDTGHSHRAIAPWCSKREIELVILDIWITSYVSLHCT